MVYRLRLRSPFGLENQMVKGYDARVESRSLNKKKPVLSNVRPSTGSGRMEEGMNSFFPIMMSLSNHTSFDNEKLASHYFFVSPISSIIPVVLFLCPMLYLSSVVPHGGTKDGCPLRFSGHSAHFGIRSLIQPIFF